MILHVISVSSGKDSTAVILLALALHPRDTLRFVFADTGNEHEDCYAYLDYLERKLGITIIRLRQDFSEWMKRRREFIANDRRVRKKRVKERNKHSVTTKVIRVRHTNKQKRRILSVLKPTGNPYLDLCLIKGRFPSRKAQFCTQFLKTEPLTEYHLSLIDAGYVVWSWQGVRADESENRRLKVEFEEVGGGLFIYRPIIRWTAMDCIEAHAAAGIVPNPLYSKGMNRVGCMPCINASKQEIREIAFRFVAHIGRIFTWESLVKLASKLGDASFFPSPDDNRGKLMGRGIYDVIEWSKTTHGGRQFNLLGGGDENSGCSSSYGLCDSAPAEDEEASA